MVSNDLGSLKFYLQPYRDESERIHKTRIEHQQEVFNNLTEEELFEILMNQLSSVKVSSRKMINSLDFIFGKPRRIPFSGFGLFLQEHYYHNVSSICPLSSEKCSVSVADSGILRGWSIASQKPRAVNYGSLPPGREKHA